MQQMWSRIAVMGMLALCSAEDIRKKKVCLNPILAFGILGVVFHMLWQLQSIGNLLLGMMVGVSMLFLSVLSAGKVGAGDGLVLLVTGIYLGLEQNLVLLLYGVFLCGIWAIFLVVFQKKNKKDTIPFIPFLLAAYICILAGD